MAEKRLIIPIYVNHRGCPQRCIFCDQDRIAGNGGGVHKGTVPDLRTERSEVVESGLSPETGYNNIPFIINEYLRIWKGGGAKEVAFYGGSFTAVDRDVQEMLLGKVHPFIENGEIDSVRVSTRPDCIDEEGLDFLRYYGVKTIELGIQSMDGGVLAAAGRGHGVDDSVMACRLIKEKGFSLGCQLMPGLPGDSRDSMIDGALSVADLGPGFVRIYPALVVKGTELESLYRKGEYKPFGLEEAVEICTEMVEIFRSRGIDVIRVGLQPTSELEESVVAGPYHPAFGELVESAIFLRKAKRLITDGMDKKGQVSFVISPEDESAFRGQRNQNINRLKERFPFLSFDILKVASLSRGSLLVN